MITLAEVKPFNFRHYAENHTKGPEPVKEALRLVVSRGKGVARMPSSHFQILSELTGAGALTGTLIRRRPSYADVRISEVNSGTAQEFYEGNEDLHAKSSFEKNLALLKNTPYEEAVTFLKNTSVLKTTVPKSYSTWEHKLFQAFLRQYPFLVNLYPRPGSASKAEERKRRIMEAIIEGKTADTIASENDITHSVLKSEITLIKSMLRTCVHHL